MQTTWDAGNRPGPIFDSSSGTLARSYDGLGRLTSEGDIDTVGYQYHGAGRRTVMHVTGRIK